MTGLTRLVVAAAVWRRAVSSPANMVGSPAAVKALRRGFDLAWGCEQVPVQVRESLLVGF
jgi:hypothetical protein